MSQRQTDPSRPDRLAGLRVKEGDPSARLPFFDVPTLLATHLDPDPLTVLPDPEPVRTTDYAGDLGCWSLLVVVLLAWWLG